MPRSSHEMVALAIMSRPQTGRKSEVPEGIILTSVTADQSGMDMDPKCV